MHSRTSTNPIVAIVHDSVAAAWPPSLACHRMDSFCPAGSLTVNIQLDCGAMTEILTRANASSFHAITEVRAARAPAGIGVQFLRMSACGYNILAQRSGNWRASVLLRKSSDRCAASLTQNY